MPTYQEGVGIYIADTLQSSDVGNVPNPDRVTNPAGTPGRLNGNGTTGEGTIYYKGAGTPDGLLSGADVDDLSEYFGVTTRTVERWFGIPGPNSQVQYRNCVPLATVGHAPYTLSYSDNRKTLQRFLLACCLTVQGGVQRVPIFSAGQKNGDPYEIGDVKQYERPTFDTLSDALDWVYNLLVGNIDPMLQQAWVQIQLEPDGTGGWEVWLWFFYPRFGEASDYSDMPTDGQAQLGDETQ